MDAHNVVGIVAAAVLVVLVGTVAVASAAALFAVVVVVEFLADNAEVPDSTAVHVASAAIADADVDVPVAVFVVVVVETLVAGSVVVVVVVFFVVVVIGVVNLEVEVVENCFEVWDTEDTHADVKADHLMVDDDGERNSCYSGRKILPHS